MMQSKTGNRVAFYFDTRRSVVAFIVSIGVDESTRSR